MRLIIVSGLSGSGKSVALHMLEDLDFYCVDNIPAALLKPFVSHTLRSRENLYHRTAVGIDARNTASEIATVPDLVRELKSSGIEAGRVVVELSEELATKHLKEAKELRALVTHLGFQFAIENFGSGRDSQNLLRHLPSNYVKIDGSLMQGLANDRPLQEQVKALVDAARGAQVTTIAERVEDANTMAVLWQLGVEFVQGYFVSSPEEVVLGA